MMRFLASFFIVSFLLFSSTASALNFFEAAAGEYGIRADILYCISLVESRQNLYAVRLDSKKDFRRYFSRYKIPYKRIYLRGKHCYRYSLFPETEGQYKRILNILHLAQDYDLGMMQINKYWIDKYDLDPVQLVNAKVSIYWGAYILADCLQRAQNLWKGVQCYNTGKVSRLDKRRNRYPFRVYETCKRVYNEEFKR